MIDFDAVKVLVLASSATLGCSQELRRLLATDGDLQEVSKGRHSAGEALSIYEIRARSAEKAGADVLGIHALLQELSTCPSTQSLLVFHYRTSSRYFSLFVCEEGQAVVGCISVPRRTSDGAI